LNWGGSGRLFVGRSEILNGLPQAQGMSWEYQCFYKGPHMGEAAQVSGIRLNNWGAELIVALGNQGSKEILTSLTRIPVGKGNVVLSTLNILPNLNSQELSAVVAKKLFLNLLK
ncbi:MAG: beta-galactosidase, partial [Mucilaginibacter sp.]|nr:beta-galactosidase [Mucilaginibacter sp.]